MLSLAAESCHAGASLMQLKLKAASNDDAMMPNVDAEGWLRERGQGCCCTGKA